MTGFASVDSGICALSSAPPSPFDILYIERFELMNDRREVICANRSKMLANARSLIASSKSRPFSIRRLSVRAGCSAQTLYNNLGDKQDILVSAVNDLSTAFVRYAHGESGLPNGLLRFVMGFRESCREFTDYHTSTARIFYDDKILHNRVHKYGTMLLQNLIVDSTDRDRNLSRDNAKGICSAVSSLISGAIFDMIDTGYDDKSFFDQVVTPSAILSMSIVDHPHKQRIEGWLSDATDQFNRKEVPQIRKEFEADPA